MTSIIVLGVFYKLDATYERQKVARLRDVLEALQDTCSLTAILVPCCISALLLAKTPGTQCPIIEIHMEIHMEIQYNSMNLNEIENEIRSQLVDILWTFSQFCEGFAMVPQYVFCYRDRMAKDVFSPHSLSSRRMWA